MHTFDELFADHKLTDQERVLLVWYLVNTRARKTVETLLPKTKIDIRDYGAKSPGFSV